MHATYAATLLAIASLVIAGCSSDDDPDPPEVDAAQMSPTDGGVEPDASAEPIDAGTPAEDASTPTEDAGAPDVDGGTEPIDAAVVGIDSAMINDPLGLSDPFDGDALDGDWNQFQPELVDVEVSGGELHLTPNQESVWYQDQRGPFFHKEVSGDFIVTTRARVRKDSDRSAYVGPAGHYQLAGLMVRNPLTGPENYVFVVVGDRETLVDLYIETKSTRGNRSTVGRSYPARDSSDVDLRICRVGSSIRLYKREIGDDTWAPAGTRGDNVSRDQFTRSDLPETVQVGIIAYALSHSQRRETFGPDMRASFEFIEYEPVSSVDDCTQ